MSDNRLERAIWQSMVASQSLPFISYARATSGQVTWVFVNVELDADERKFRTHVGCRPKLDEVLCEVCGKPVDVEGARTVEELYGDDIYRPGDDIEVDLTEDEMTERRRELQEMFDSGETNFTVDGENGENG